jgi:hypothetical protein
LNENSPNIPHVPAPETPWPTGSSQPQPTSSRCKWQHKKEPVAILQTRQIPCSNVAVVHWLVQWENLPLDDASWENVRFIKGMFPSFYNNTIQAWFQQSATP